MVFQGNLSHTVGLKIDNVNASVLFGEVMNNGGFPIRYHYEVGSNGAFIILFLEQSFTLSVDMVYFNFKHFGIHFWEYKRVVEGREDFGKAIVEVRELLLHADLL